MTTTERPRIGRQPQRLPPVRVPVPALRPPGARFVVPRLGTRSDRSGPSTWFWRVALAIALVALAASVVGPRLGLYRVNVVLSNSMQPQWSAGDLVVTTPGRPQDLRVGQIITYHPPIDGRPSVTHRIVEISESGARPVIRTRGDANATDDPWGLVRLEGDTVWTVRRKVPKIGWGIAFMQRREIAFVATVLAPLALLVLILLRIWRPTPR